MATFRALGTAAAGTTSIIPGYPAGVKLGDLLLLHVVNKYPTAAPSTPTGWTFLQQASGGSGAAGVDSGTVYSTVFYKIAVAADVTASAATATFTVTITGANASEARVACYFKQSPTSTWSLATAVGADSSPGLAWSVTGDVNPGISVGDMLLTFTGVNADVATASAHAYAVPGISTFSAIAERTDQGTTSGDDLAITSTEATCQAGTATGVPVYTATRSATSGSAPAGATVFVRIREVGGTDGPNAWAVPSCAADFETRSEVALKSIWPCQVANVTAPLTDIGAAWANPTNLNLNPFGDTATLGLFDEAVTGWSRRAIGGHDGDQITWRRSSAMLTIGSNSAALVGLMSFPSLPTAQGPIMVLASDGSTVQLSLRTDGKLELNVSGVLTVGRHNFVDGAEHFLCFYFNRTAGTVGVQTDRELIEGTYDAAVTSSGNSGFGYVQNTAIDTPEFRLLWAAHATGSGAERDWRAFLVHLGVAVVDEHALTGTLSAAGEIASGELVVDRPLSGTLSAAGELAAGDLVVDRTLEGALAASGEVASGDLVVNRELSGQLAATGAIASGELVVDRPLAGALAGAGALDGGDLVVDRTLEGALAAAGDIVAGELIVESGIPPVWLDEYDAVIVAIDDVATLLALDDHAATLEIDPMSYILKAGDLLPGISGKITLPESIDLTGATLTLRYRGRSQPVRVRVAVNDGLLSADAVAHTKTWGWHYVWVAGDTDDPDEYEVGISTLVGGRPLTLPNSGWSTFAIEPQL